VVCLAFVIWISASELFARVPQANDPSGCRCCITTPTGCSFECNHRGTYDSGNLINSHKLPDSGSGYYHYLGGDAPNSDTWACRSYLVAKVIQVGQDWNRKPRMGVGDLSLPCGGSFDHISHQNGLDVDVRYVRNDGHEALFDFNDPDWQVAYDQAGTQELVKYWMRRGASLILADRRSRIRGPGVKHVPNHANHFHVRFPDPDVDPSQGCEPQ